MKRLARASALMLVLLLILLAAAPFTAPGTRLLLALLPAASPLQVQYRSGRLAGELRLAQLDLTIDGLALQLTDLHTALDPGCLWQSRFCFTRLDLGTVTLELFAAAEEGGGRGGVDSEPLVLPVSVLAPEVRIGALQVHWQGGSWEQQQASLAARLEGSGVYLGDVVVADGRLTLDAGGDAAANTEPARLILPEVALPLLLVVDGMELQRPRLRVGNIDQPLQRLALDLRWQGTALTLRDLAITSAEWGSLSAAGDMELAAGWPLTLQVDASPVSAVLPVPLQGRTLQLQLEGVAAALEATLRVAGEPALALTASVDLLAPALPFVAEARLQGPANVDLTSLPGWPAALADARLTLPLTLAAVGDLRTQAITVRGELSSTAYPLLDLHLAATHSAGELTVQALQLVDIAGDGSLSLTGTLFYGDELRWQTVLESPGIELPRFTDYVSGRLAGRLASSGTLSAERWQASLQAVAISGEVNGLPASVSGDLTLASGTYVTAGELLVEANGARVSLRGGADTAAAVELAIDDLGRWQSGGRGTVQLRAAWRPQASTLALQGSASGVRWENIRIDEGTLAGELDLTASGVLDARLRLQQVSLGDVFLGTVSAQVSGTREAPTLLLASAGRLGGAVRLAARQQGTQWTAQLSTDGLQTPLGPLTLEAPVTLRYGPAGTSVAAHCWRLPESTLCMSQWLLGANGGGTAALEGDLALFAAVLPQQLQVAGPLSASLRAEWAPDSALRASAQILSPEGTITQFYSEGESATLSWESLAVTLDQSASGLVLDAALERNTARALTLALRLPADRSGSLAGSLDLEQMQLAALRPFLPQLARLEGELSGGLRLAGSLAEPELFGELTWAHGALQSHSNPTELRAVAVAVTLLGDRAEIAGTGLLGGGALEISGAASLRPELGLTLALRGEDNRLLYPPSTQAVVSSDLRLRTTTEGLSIAGELQVDSGTLAYEQLPAGSVSLSPDIVEVDYVGNPVAQKVPLNLDAEVRVQIRDRFRVQGKDLNVTVGGDLSLQQVSGRPLQVFGNLNTVGGEFRAYGQRLLVRQGRIAFTGLPQNPEVNLRAEREIPADKVRAGVQVSGTLEEPRLTLYSEPALSQTETLSYLLRGRGMDTGAGADGTAMALSVGTGLVNQSGIIEGLNNLPGLRNVEFGAEGSEDDTAATVSGYIGDRIYLSYGVGLYEPVNVLTARLYLQAHLWLEVVSRLENSVDLYYSFDID